MRLRGDVDDLIERTGREVGELKLDDRALAHPGRPDRRADESLLGDRRVHHAVGGELLPQPFGDAERAAEVADVLAEEEDALVLAHRVAKRRRDRAEVGGRRRRRLLLVPGCLEMRRHAVIPPSTVSTAPVTYDASAEARKRIGATTSSGSASRPSGVRERMSSR